MSLISGMVQEDLPSPWQVACRSGGLFLSPQALCLLITFPREHLDTQTKQPNKPQPSLNSSPLPLLLWYVPGSLAFTPQVAWSTAPISLLPLASHWSSSLEQGLLGSVRRRLGVLFFPGPVSSDSSSNPGQIPLLGIVL